MKTKKKFKPAFVVDLTYDKTAEELFEEIIMAKYENKLPMSHYEIGKFAEYKAVQALDSFVEDMFCGHNAVVFDGEDLVAMDAIKVEVKEKLPWYKRFWNWLTRRK